MENEMITICPRCSNTLIATKLNCDNCKLELGGEFRLSKFDYLSHDELDFIESFLKFQGSFKELQIEKEMSYPAVKKKYIQILDKLNLTCNADQEGVDGEMGDSNFQPINQNDSLVVKVIKKKLNENNGQAFISLFNGDKCLITYDNSGKGLASPKIPPVNQLVWEAFDAAVELVVKNGGRAVKGNARSGAKLGSDDLPLDSIEGYIASKVHGVQIGQSAFGPGFVIAAVLDWAGICYNKRGYLTIRPEFSELKY